MAQIISASIDVTKLPKEKFVKGKNGSVYCNVTIAVNDNTDDYGNNASLYATQTKEEREAKVKRTYFGNGRVIWTDGKATVAEQKQSQPQPTQKESLDFSDDLPF